MNIRLDIEYDGAPFCGWQRQAGIPTIQAIIEDVLTKLIGHRTIIYGASRTDSGVHAMGQVANFFSDKYAANQWKAILNDHLPREIRVLSSREVPAGFHSQKDALKKRYEYHILNREASSALDRKVYYYPRSLDWEKIEAALPFFIGKKNFRSFQGAKATVKTTIREIYSAKLIKDKADFYCISLEGNGFLKQMVRSIVGTLIEVGEGRRNLDSIPDLFNKEDRRLAGRTLPPQGLFLVQIQYPEYCIL